MKFLLIAFLICLLLFTGCTCAPTEQLSGHSAPSGSVNRLSNPNANQTTQEIYDYICSLSGTGCLAAQQESYWIDGPDYEMDYLLKVTGKLPAIRGLDYMSEDFTDVNRRAIDWWSRGGLVVICWHTGCDFLGGWSDCLNDTIRDWDAVLTPGTHAHEEFLAAMDKAADALSQLQDAGVTVLWRPFHEFDGKWFWWGKGGSDTFIRLWQLMYTRYTDHWGLNNLIWVLPYSQEGGNYAEWYPGDAYCDILGADSYHGGGQDPLYRELTDLCSSKPCCFHECGTAPTETELQATPWTWFMIWHSSSLTDDNDPAALKALYNSNYVITLDELPAFGDT